VDEELDIRDVSWINATGAPMQESEWLDANMRCFGMLIDGRARPTGLRQRGTEATLLLLFNAHHDFVEFTLPEYSDGSGWELLLDTNIADGGTRYQGAAGDKYGLTARSLALFARDI
jgi:isoamylase